MSITKSLVLRVFAVVVSSCLVPELHSQTLIWDANTTTAGQPAGAGQWFGANQWFDGTNNVTWSNSGAEIAQLGAPGAALVSGNTITITGATAANVGGINFMSLASAPGSTNQFTLAGASGGTLNFATNAIVQAQETTSTGSNFITFASSLALTGNGLTFQKFTGSGTTTQFIRVDSTSNPGLTGTLTIKGNDGGIFLRSAAATTFGAMSGVVVEANSAFSATGGGSYTLPISVAGFGGASQYGAIRVDTNSTTFTQPITLTADAGIQTNTGGVTGTVLAGGVTGAFGFTRFATGSGTGTLAITGVSNYTGTTTLGRLGTFAGGVTILDFANSSTATDLIYNGVTANNVSFIGGNNSATVLRLNGKADTVNSQSLGNISVGGAATTIGGLAVLELISSGTGQMNASIGTITRDARGMIAFIAPASGTISTTQADGVLGPWATFRNAAGVTSWAQVVAGKVEGGFTGNLAYSTGTAISAVGGYSAASHLTLSQASKGAVSVTGTTTDIATVSMTDTLIDRSVTLGGNTLRLGATPTGGGVQLAANAKNLTISGGTLTAGGATNTAGQLFLTNQSNTAVLQVDANITNNGTGAIMLLVNGVAGSRTVLTGTNTFTGSGTIASGTVEMRSAGALGSSGTVSVLEGAALLVSGGFNISRTFSVAGSGPTSLGALRLLGGSTTMTGAVTQTAPTLISAEAGASLTLQAAATTNIVAGSHAVTFGGAGTISVTGRVGVGSSGLTKSGNGMLILGGDNNFTGAVSISQGVLRATHANALGVSGTTFSSTTISSGAALELAGSITLAAEPITLGSSGVNNGGGIRNVSGNNVTTGVITLNATTQRIHSDAGTLTLGGTGNATSHTSSSSRTLIFGGAGNVEVIRPMVRTSTGAFVVSKDGNGMVTLATTVSNTATTPNAGVIKLDFSGANSPASNILSATSTLTPGGGVLRLTGKATTANAQTFGTFTPGSLSEIEFEQNGATSLDLTVGDFSRSWTGILSITPATTGTFRTTGTSGVADNAALARDGRVYAVIRDAVNGDEWAGTTAISGGTRDVAKLSALGLYTPSDATTLAGHANIAAGVTTTTLAAETTVSSLRFGETQATTIQRTASEILNTGGILVSSTVGANDSTIVAQTRPTASTESNPDLVIVQNNTLGSLIFQNGIINRTETGKTTVSIAKSGLGTVVLAGTSTFGGNLKVYEGAVQLAGGSVMSTSMEFLIGSGARSGKVILGSTTAASPSIDYITTVGSGTDNRIVGGSSAMSRLTITGSTTTASTFSSGFLGGPGTNENNLEFRMASATGLVTLGGDNTYSGATILSRGVVEVTRLADAGTASSFGTGSASSIITMGDATTSVVGSNAIATIRYLGTENSTTNRVLNLTNSDVAAEITAVSAVLENNGTGTVKFTSPFTVGGSNTVGRVFKLTGTNTGANEIAGVGEISTANASSLVKEGTGTWTITGASTYTGGTTITGGRLLVSNTTGSATGLGPVNASAGTTIGGNGKLAPAADQQLIFTSVTVQPGAEAAGATPSPGTLTFQTSGTGATRFLDSSFVDFDLFTGAGSGNNIANPLAADLISIGGQLELGTNVVLRVSNPNNMTSWAAGDTWKLFDWSTLTGTVSGTFATSTLPTLPFDLEWDLSQLTTAGTIIILQVPEPSRMLLGGFAMLLLARRRRR
ncbi:MAG: autotransporter-associated beta strand repeat-containing protein [Verrucomicrobiaceae bacterium]